MSAHDRREDIGFDRRWRTILIGAATYTCLAFLFGLQRYVAVSGKRADAADSFSKALALEPLNTVASEYLRHIERSTASR